MLLSVLGFEGLGGIVGSGMLIASPDGKYMDMPVSIMHGTFSDFLIPGIILFGMSVLSIISFTSVLRRSDNDWFMASTAIFGWTMWFWVEIAIVLELYWLHAMWGLPVLLGGVAAVSLIPHRYEWLRKAGLICGIIASLLYVVINIIIPMSWPEYDSASQTVSELSAVDAPTRFLWIVLSFPYSLLMLAFAASIVRTAKENRPLSMAGKLLIVYSATGPLWYFAPMHLREVLATGGGTMSDTMHLVFAGISQLIFLSALYLSSKGLGRSFRWYSLATFIVLMLFGTLTFIEAPGVSANTPTPMIGIWERINIGVFMLWVIVLGTILLQKKYASVRTD